MKIFSFSRLNEFMGGERSDGLKYVLNFNLYFYSGIKSAVVGVRVVNDPLGGKWLLFTRNKINAD